MSRFSDDWLALREPYDARARNAKVFAAVAALFEQHDTIQIVDLGCGTGSTMRALSPLLAARQKWRLVDNDTDCSLRPWLHALLSVLPPRLWRWI